jgi:hypothetical protein
MTGMVRLLGVLRKAFAMEHKNGLGQVLPSDVCWD